MAFSSARSTSTTVHRVATSRAAESEQQLLERCRGGDTTAFDEIVEQHQNRVFNLCYWVLNDHEAAADAAQDAFVRAFRAIGNFRGDCAFSTWLHRIAVNVALNAARSRRHTPLPFSALENDETGTRPPEPVDPIDNPQDMLTRRERRRVVRCALAELPEHHRLVLVLFDIQGHSYEEMAELLELPLGTVKSRLNRARLALRDKLEAQRELFQD